MTSDARLAIDIGGTFTDVVLNAAKETYTVKVLTTPDAPEVGAIDGIAKVMNSAAIPPSQVAMIIHGTTLATNAII